MPPEFCDQHIKIVETLGDIKGDVKSLKTLVESAVENVAVHIEHGSAWRIAIATIGVTVFIAIVSFAFWCGQISKQIEINTEKLKMGNNVAMFKMQSPKSQPTP